MSDTPETDAKVSAHIGFYSCATVPAELCRRMERERDEARAVADELASAASHCLGWHDCRLRIGEKITATLQRWRSMKGER